MVLIRVVGIVLVIALLTIPAAIAGQLSKKLWQMMLWAIVFSNIFIISGLYISLEQDLPSGAAIVLLAAAVYLIMLAIAQIKIKHRA